MSTNYYLIHNVCSCCKRQDQTHIGKQSGGWEFMFQAFWEDNCLTAEKIDSKKKWEKILKYVVDNGRGFIQDEYGRHVPVVKFLKDIDASRTPKSQNHVDYCKIHYPSSVRPDGDFKDSDGWSFSFGDFS